MAVPTTAAASTRGMTWDKEKKHLSTEASDHREVFPVGTFPGRVDVWSHWTGVVRTFNRVVINKDREGEWTDALYREPESGVTLTVFND